MSTGDRYRCVINSSPSRITHEGHENVNIARNPRSAGALACECKSFGAAGDGCGPRVFPGDRDRCVIKCGRSWIAHDGHENVNVARNPGSAGAFARECKRFSAAGGGCGPRGFPGDRYRSVINCDPSRITHEGHENVNIARNPRSAGALACERKCFRAAGGGCGPRGFLVVPLVGKPSRIIRPSGSPLNHSPDAGPATRPGSSAGGRDR
jgi:hypothetical protein